MSQTGVANIQPSTEPPDKVTFVLVHCAFGGGWAWKYVAPLLRQAGHTVYTPSLTGLGERLHLGSPDELVRDDPRWNVIELSSNHMAPVADPDLVAEALLGILKSLKKQ